METVHYSSAAFLPSTNSTMHSNASSPLPFASTGSGCCHRLPNCRAPTTSLQTCVPTAASSWRSRTQPSYWYPKGFRTPAEPPRTSECKHRGLEVGSCRGGSGERAPCVRAGCRPRCETISPSTLYSALAKVYVQASKGVQIVEIAPSRWLDVSGHVAMATTCVHSRSILQSKVAEVGKELCLKRDSNRKSARHDRK